MSANGGTSVERRLSPFALSLSQSTAILDGSNHPSELDRRTIENSGVVRQAHHELGKRATVGNLTAGRPQ